MLYILTSIVDKFGYRFHAQGPAKLFDGRGEDDQVLVDMHAVFDELQTWIIRRLEC